MPKYLFFYWYPFCYVRTLTKMEQRFTFRVVAQLFLVEDIPYNGYDSEDEAEANEIPTYTKADVDAYINDYLPYNRIMEDVANSFETTLNKCIQSVEYNSATCTITAVLQILMEPGVYPFAGETVEDYAEDLKDDILSNSFEDGCYGSEDCIFHMEDTPVGFFDIRDRKTLSVEFVSVAPGPTQEEYEASWKPDAEVLTKISYSEALEEFRRCIALKVKDKRDTLLSTYIYDHARRGIYGLNYLYRQLLERPFYKTDEERLAAFERIMGATQ